MQLACPGLFHSAASITTVVTSSAFLAAVGRRQYAAEQIAAGRESWLTPRIMSQNAWLTSWWDEARYRSDEVPTLLSRSQELLVWEQVVENDRLNLFDSYATARLASRAARWMSEWEISSRSDLWQSASDPAQFKRWLDTFADRCRREHWVTLAGLWPLLPEWMERGWCASEPATFLLSARSAPALTRILQLQSDRLLLRNFERLSNAAAIPGHASVSPEEELTFAARWARAAWEAHPAQSVAVFIANLATRPAEVERVFRDVFYPGSCRALADRRLSAITQAPSAYNVAVSRPLLEQPLIAGAVQLLELLRESMPVSLAGTILRSRWIKGATQQHQARARADADLRRLRELDISPDDLASVSARDPMLLGFWAGVRRVRRDLAAVTFAEWARRITDLLAVFDWPGDDELNAEEQQQLDAWQSTLSELSALSLVAESVDLGSALTHLKQLLRQASGAGGSGLLAPVQILDLADAPGLQFDRSLVTGLGEETWPPARGTMPFLPIGMQRKHELPGSSQAALETERQELLAALFGSAPQLTAAWHGRLSPAVQSYVSESRASESSVWEGQTTWQAYKPALLEELEDTFAPAFRIDGSVLGGTGIIKSQSHCPFQAFVKYRLHSRSLEDGRLGFDERERGGHLHKTLQLVWQRLGNSQNLKAQSKEELQQLVAECAREAIRRPPTSPFALIITAVELARLQEITLAWLEIERRRLHPFTVENVEAEGSVELAGMTLELRIDRIDRTPDGGLILIDYKSGIQNVKKLETPRPEEPQLLIYAAGLGDQVEGIVFGQLKREDIRPVGLTRDAHFQTTGRRRMVDVAGNSWNARMEEWREEVERLAEQFKAGYAAVDPRKGACDFCEQKVVCRVGERSAESEPETE